MINYIQMSYHQWIHACMQVLSVVERQSIAYHESGHAVVSWFLEHGESVVKVSIVPRGTSGLGFAQYASRENVVITKEQIVDRSIQALGGRAAEEVWYHFFIMDICCVF